MNLIDFYLDVIKSLNDNKVEYLLVGGHAVIYHGYIRATIDMDIWVNTTEENIDCLYNSFQQLGYESSKCKAAIENLKAKHMIIIPKGNNLIDILDSFMMKKDFKNAFKNHETLTVNNVNIKVINLEDLIDIKHKSNIIKDLNDVKELKKVTSIHRPGRNLF